MGMFHTKLVYFSTRLEDAWHHFSVSQCPPPRPGLTAAAMVAGECCPKSSAVDMETPVSSPAKPHRRNSLAVPGQRRYGLASTVKFVASGQRTAANHETRGLVPAWLA